MTQPYYDPYSRIERAMVARLDAGMRGMVREVVSYGGQLDDDLTLIVQALPAVWVTFGGIQETQALSTSHKKWKVRGRFAVMVGQKNARSEVANRQGSGRPQEVGTNALVWAVRRLLTDQDLVDQDANLKIDPLSPGRVRPIFNTTVAAISVGDFISRLWQPGMHALSTSGSLRAAQTLSTGAAMRSSPSITKAIDLSPANGTMKA